MVQNNRMNRVKEDPNTFLWVLRGLSTLFLLGFLVNLYLALFIAEIFPTGNLGEDLLALGFILVLAGSYALVWMRREFLAGILFILWYLALWPAQLFIGGEIFGDPTTPGILLLILGILFLIYHAGARRKRGT